MAVPVVARTHVVAFVVAVRAAPLIERLPSTSTLPLKVVGSCTVRSASAFAVHDDGCVTLSGVFGLYEPLVPSATLAEVGLYATLHAAGEAPRH